MLWRLTNSTFFLNVSLLWLKPKITWRIAMHIFRGWLKDESVLLFKRNWNRWNFIQITSSLYVKTTRTGVLWAVGSKVLWNETKEQHMVNTQAKEQQPRQTLTALIRQFKKEAGINNGLVRTETNQIKGGSCRQPGTRWEDCGGKIYSLYFTNTSCNMIKKTWIFHWLVFSTLLLMHIAHDRLQGILFPWAGTWNRHYNPISIWFFFSFTEARQGHAANPWRATAQLNLLQLQRHAGN